MKKPALIFTFFIICWSWYGQDSLSNLPHRNQLIVHYYPSALLAGDISFGIEHRYKNRFAQELSLNIKAFQPKLYYYDRGYRVDYLIKCYLYNGNVFRLSANLSFEYKNIYFVNKQIDYYYSREIKQQPNELYQTTLEDRRYIEYGWGIGNSLNFKLYKHVFVGADIGLNFVRDKVTYNFKEILYHDPYILNYNELPSTYIRQTNRVVFSPLIRLKLSYFI